MARRQYRLGKRQPSVDRTSAAILAAARSLLSSRPISEMSVGEVSRQAGVSRITVYNRFGSRAGLIDAVARGASPQPAARSEGGPREALNRRLADACAVWSSDPGLHRNLPSPARPGQTELDRQLAESLAEADQLRPGCSIKEAEDVIAAISSFAVFDRLHKDGRRSVPAVTEILTRFADTILVG